MKEKEKRDEMRDKRRREGEETRRGEVREQ